MASAKWQVLREEALARAGNGCTECGAEHYLEVHHLTYDRLGQELPEDVRVLCRSCHGKLHPVQFEAAFRRRLAAETERITHPETDARHVEFEPLSPEELCYWLEDEGDSSGSPAAD